MLSHGILVKSGNAKMATMGCLAGNCKQSTVLTGSLLRTFHHLDLGCELQRSAWASSVLLDRQGVDLEVVKNIHFANRASNCSIKNLYSISNWVPIDFWTASWEVLELDWCDYHSNNYQLLVHSCLFDWVLTDLTAGYSLHRHPHPHSSSRHQW